MKRTFRVAIILIPVAVLLARYRLVATSLSQNHECGTGKSV